MIYNGFCLFVSAVVGMRESGNFRRWTPLVFSTIMQGLLSALFLASITRPVQ